MIKASLSNMASYRGNRDDYRLCRQVAQPQVDQLSQDLRRGHFAMKLIAVNQVFQRALPRSDRD